jgi:hypothetical protein
MKYKCINTECKYLSDESKVSDWSIHFTIGRFYDIKPDGVFINLYYTYGDLGKKIVLTDIMINQLFVALDVLREKNIKKLLDERNNELG